MQTSRIHIDSSAPHSRRRRFDAGGLRAECRELRELCQAKRYATDDELDAYWPGGAENPARDLDAWIYTFQQYGRFLGRKELMDRTRDAARGQLAQAVSSAASAQPVTAPLTVGTFAVYPKSYHTLEYLGGIERLLAPLATLQAQTMDAADAHGVSAVWPEVVRSLAVRTWAWILTTPGCGMPWGDDATSAIEPPDWTLQLAPQDLLVIDQAHRAVNHERLQIMAAAFPASEGGSSSLALGGFIAGYGYEHGIQPADVARRFSLGELFAGSIAAIDAQQQAEARAEAKAAKAKRDAPPHAARTPRGRW